MGASVLARQAVPLGIVIWTNTAFVEQLKEARAENASKVDNLNHTYVVNWLLYSAAKDLTNEMLADH